MRLLSIFALSLVLALSPSPAAAQQVAPYQGFLLTTTTPLGATDASWAFGVGDYNRDGAADLFGIHRDDPVSGTTSVHVLDGATSFQTFLLQTPTALLPTDANWDFAIADSTRDGVPDVVGIARGGASGSTEVHVLDGAAGYSRFALQTGTALHPTSADWTFAAADYDGNGVPDILGVARGGASNSTEQHVLDGADLGRFLLHTGTGLSPTTARWDFGAADSSGNGRAELFAIDRQDPGTNRTTVHVLDDGAGVPGRVGLSVATGLGPTDAAWSFVPADVSGSPVAELFAIRRGDPTTVAVLDGASRPVPPPDPGPGRCAPSAGLALTAGLARKSVGFATAPQVRGRLVGADGAPVGGAAVEVSTDAAGWAPAGTAVTAADGTWTLALPRGPRRRVYAAVNDGDTTPACSVVVRQVVRAGVTLRPTRRRLRNGARVGLRGRLLGVRNAGRRVDVQGFEPRRRRWIPVRTVRTDARGRFAMRYRFTATRRTTRYRFRALVRPDRGFPYARGTSRPVTVRVRP